MKIAKVVSLMLVALMTLGIINVLPAFSADGAGTATIYVYPPVTSLTKPPYGTGSTFIVHVNIANYTHVASWQVKLIYDNSLLSTVSGDVDYSAGDFVFTGSYSGAAASVGNYDLTHDYVMMTAASNGGVEYAGSNAGLMDINFTIVGEPANPGDTVGCTFTYDSIDTWTCDTDIEENAETDITGEYTLEYLKVKPYIELAPSTKTLPATPGDYIIGDHFFWDINIHDVSEVDKIILAEYQILYDTTWLKLVWIWEGTFMNDAEWAPYGTFDNVTLPDGSTFIMVNPNETTGEWDWGEFPEGDGLLATAEFEVIKQPPEPADPVISVELAGIFGEYFIDSDVNYVPYAPAHNATLTLNGHYWNAPVAALTWTPTTPLPGDLVTFDATGSYDADPWDSITYFLDFGDGENATTAISTHTYSVMGNYIVTLNVTDTMGKFDVLVKTIYVVFGRQIDVYTQNYDPADSGVGPNMNSSSFWPQKTVNLTVFLSYNGVGVQFKPVAFYIYSPNGVYDFTETAITDSEGYCHIEFGLPWPCGDWNDTMGLWHVVVKADIRCVVVEDNLWFKVWWLAEITSVVPKESSYHYCQDAEFDVFFRYYGWIPRNVTITIAVFDDLDVCIGYDSVTIELNEVPVWCNFAYGNTTLTVHIPKWTFVGVGTVKANIFYAGAAACPQKEATFVLEAAP